MRSHLLPLLILGLAIPNQAYTADLNATAAAAARYQSGQPTDALRALDAQLLASAQNPPLRRELENALIQLLAPGSTIEAKLFACQHLAAIGTDASVPALSNLLRDPQTVAMACLALGNYPSRLADDALLNALPNLSGSPKCQVIATLGSRHQPRSSKPLLPLVNDPNSEVADTAVLALSRIADSSALKTINALRATSPRPAVLEASLLLADTLAAHGQRKPATAIYQDLLQPSRASHVRAGAFGRLLRIDKDSGANRIETLLRSPSTAQAIDQLRSVAIAAIGQLPQPTAPARFAPLLATLPDSEKPLLLQALADFGPRAPRSAMAAQLNSANPEVRLAALRAFARLNHPEDIPVLVEALSERSLPAERQLVESALIQLPGGAATDRTLLLALPNSRAAAKPALVTALARRGSHNAVAAILNLASDSDPAIARSAWKGLSRLATITDLSAMLDCALKLNAASLRDAAASALAPVLNRIPDPSARTQPISARLAASREPDSRAFLTRLLPLAASPQALQLAQNAAKDPDAIVRDAAVRALADWPDLAAWDSLMTLFRDSTAEAHRTLALRGLVRLAHDDNAHPSDQLLQHYADLLAASRNDDDRKLILGALSGCPHPTALKLALDQLDNHAVRLEAVQAVQRIADTIKGAHPNEATAALRRIAATNQ